MGIFDFFKKTKNIENDNGLNESYYNDGKGELETRGYKKNGKFHGNFEIYFENGQLKGEVNMKNGLPDGVTKSYYENGQLNIDGNVKNGKAYGLHKVYYENGSLKHEENWIVGIKHGACKSYYENGQIERESIIKNDIEEEVKFYDIDGNQIKSEKKKRAPKKTGKKKKSSKPKETEKSNKKRIKKNKKLIASLSKSILESKDNLSELMIQEEVIKDFISELKHLDLPGDDYIISEFEKLIDLIKKHIRLCRDKTNRKK